MKRNINSISLSSAGRSRRKRIVDSEDYTIPTPSIDSVLQNIASQAVLSSNADGVLTEISTAHKPAEELECGESTSSHSKISRRILLMDRCKDREANLQSTNYRKNIRQPSKAVARLVRASNADALYRPSIFHEGNSSDSSSESFAQFRAGSSSAASTIFPNRPRIMRNNVDVGPRVYASRFSFATESPAGSNNPNGASSSNFQSTNGLPTERDCRKFTSLSDNVAPQVSAPAKQTRLVAITDDSAEKESQREVIELDAETSSNNLPQRNRPLNGANSLNRSVGTNSDSGAITEINGGTAASNGASSGESFMPFCKNCVAEFPRLLKSLDNLDSRIEKMSTLMRMALDTTRQHGADGSIEIAKSIALLRQCGNNDDDTTPEGANAKL